MSATIELGGKMYKVTLTEVTKEVAPTKSRNLTMRTNPETEGTPKEENVSQMGGKKAKKEKKAKGTRKMNPYMAFAKNARPEVLAKHPELKSDVVAVGRKIGEMWRGLSDAEKAKY